MLRMAKRMALGAALVVGLATGAGAAEADKRIEIGWTAWSDAEAVTKMAKQIIEERFGYEVELTLADIAVQYQGVAKGDLDLMMMSWLPTTHADYMKQVADRVVNLGPIYTEARLGWVVPAYIPEDQLSSIADLSNAEVAEKLDGKIQGIDPGAGLMRLSNEALKEYGLDDYELVSASGAAMTAALERAIKREDWIVVTGWSPHWKFGAHDLRYLEDPKGVLGGPERVHVIARQGFYQDHPEVAAFLARMYIPIDELQQLMYEAQQTSYEEAVAAYIDNNPKRVEYWVTGQI